MRLKKKPREPVSCLRGKDKVDDPSTPALRAYTRPEPVEGLRANGGLTCHPRPRLRRGLSRQRERRPAEFQRESGRAKAGCSGCSEIPYRWGSLPASKPATSNTSD